MVVCILDKLNVFCFSLPPYQVIVKGEMGLRQEAFLVLCNFKVYLSGYKYFKGTDEIWLLMSPHRILKMQRHALRVLLKWAKAVVNCLAKYYL